MNLKFIIFILFNLNFFPIPSCLGNDKDDSVDQYLTGQIDSIKRSLEEVNKRLEFVWERYTSLMAQRETIEDEDNTRKPIFDIRFDIMPKHCTTNQTPSSCEAATKCTRSSGIYNLTDTHYSNTTFLAYCDNESYDGNWLYILKIIDGTENFYRPWVDYVNGFGDINGEFWIGLEKLYALTNYYGAQELLVHLENFGGRKEYARYDNFVVGNADEKYKLKSLGHYRGTVRDELYLHVGQKFSTYDSDNDGSSTGNCAKKRHGAFWFYRCGNVNPTGPYLRGKYNDTVEGSYWNSFEGPFYAPKTIIFMIRRRNAEKLN